MLKGFSISLLLSEVQAKSFDWAKNIQVPVIKEPDTLDAEPMNVWADNIITTKPHRKGGCRVTAFAMPGMYYEKVYSK